MTGTFDLPSGSSVTADPVYSGTCIPITGTSVSANQQSCSLTPRVNGVNTMYGHHESEISWDDSASVTLTGTMPSTSDVVYTSVSYEVVQHIFIGFNQPVYGYCSVDYSLNEGRSMNSMKFPKENNAAYYTYSSSTRSGTITFRSYGEPTISVDLIEYHFGETSLPSKAYQPMIVVDTSTWSYGDLVAYEEPVKDIASHNLLQKILDAILNTNDNGAAQQQVNEIKDTAENKMGGITDATQLVEQGFENLQGDAVNKLTFPGLFGGDSWTLDLGYIEQQAPELVAIMRTMLIAAVAWGCYEMLKNTVLGNRV